MERSTVETRGNENIIKALENEITASVALFNQTSHVKTQRSEVLSRYTNLIFRFCQVNNLDVKDLFKSFQKLEMKYGRCLNANDFFKDLFRRRSRLNIKPTSKLLLMHFAETFVLDILLNKHDVRKNNLFLVTLKTAQMHFQNRFTKMIIASDPKLFIPNHLGYFFGQINEQFYFELIINRCGFDYNKPENRVYIEWNQFKSCVENEHSLDNMFRSYTNLYEQKASGLTLTFEGEQNENEFLEETPSLRRFGDLCGDIFKRPVHGYHLVCRVDGDKLMIPVLRLAFMDCVAVRGLCLSVEKPLFSNLETRIKSFRDNLISFDASVEDLYIKYAEAGFLMTNNQNLGMCFKCGGLVVIDFKVDPWFKHASWHPCCRFLRQQKGKQYIDEVRETLRQKIVRTDSYELQFRIDKIINNEDSQSENDSESESDNDSAWNSGSESDYNSDSDN